MKYLSASVYAVFLLTSLSVQSKDNNTQVIEKISVVGSSQNIGLHEVTNLFGHNLTSLESPRSHSILSPNTLDELSITSINELIIHTPGSFNSSFFGIAGGMDIRGGQTDNFYRGMKRLINPGNYQTTINPLNQIALHKGAPSPIYGSGRIGGFIHIQPIFKPSDLQHTLGLTLGQYNKRSVSYSLQGNATSNSEFSTDISWFTEYDNSDSYYHNNHSENIYTQLASQTLFNNVPGRLSIDLSFQDYQGQQVTGWNRVTQELIDHGTYISGSAIDTDLNKDGYTSGSEVDQIGGLGGFAHGQQGGCCSPHFVKLNEVSPNLALNNLGKTRLSPRNTLIDESDIANTQAWDAFVGFDSWYLGNWKGSIDNFVQNQATHIQTSFGYEQQAKIDSYATKLGLEGEVKWSDMYSTDMSFAINYHTSESDYFVDFDYQYFDRRDISKGVTSNDRILLASQDTHREFSNETTTNATEAGFAFNSYTRITENLNWMVGARLDRFTIEVDDHKQSKSSIQTASKPSYATSLSYQPSDNSNIYATWQKNHYINLGFSSNLSKSVLEDNEAILGSKLMELGFKGLYWDNRLSTEFAIYKQLI
ncbi:hypothetical protein C2869_06065 [Saccharobesus litoralis]|uniref:TonB-dependent receptor plug domain-containing protein n=1 Tax=Saccharobesus litoralis TaxID=2172099 RepID=A0A2S0VPM2_9ALTE|nr:TonB-dependent receptor plug domain-containing protein [Saccharobesus litoralis]AWB66030.1 hypothetical protein C2869_06065 [Saccharobesus litoralis]